MTTPLSPETPFQRLVVEQALALARELESTGAAAPDGQVLHRAEELLLGRGRDFLRTTLEQFAQQTADESSKTRRCRVDHPPDNDRRRR